jgi:hypothetical protein
MEVTVTVMESVAVMPIAMRGNAKDAIHRADSPANACADCTTYHGTDRAGRPAALSGALLGATDDALGVPDRRNRCQGERKRGGRKINPLAQAGRLRECPDLRFHSEFPL